MSQITDGTSHTIAIGETLKGDLAAESISDNYIFTTSADANEIDTCQTFPPNAADRATVWLGGQPHNNMFSTARPPNDPRVDCKAPSNGCTNFAARSAHPGGATIGFADGSTRFLSDSIDEKTMQALGTRMAEDVPGVF
jgi:prepilin-type processing-associated H-X9-DG protein